MGWRKAPWTRQVTEQENSARSSVLCGPKGRRFLGEPEGLWSGSRAGGFDLSPNLGAS